MRIDDGGYSTYTPPPHSDPPPGDTTQHGNSPQITTVVPVRYNPPPATPAQRVDLAVAKYKAAVASGDQNAIKQAKQDIYAAVGDEIGPQVDTANRGVPPEFRTLTDQQISSYGNVILRRNSSDPTTQGVLKDAIHDYQVQRKADELIPQFYGPFTPKEKLDSLKLSLQGQPPEVVARAMQDPAVQRMMQDAVKWISEPYNGLSGNDVKWNPTPAVEASQRLAYITADLPPEYAALIVKQSMPTIQKIAGVEGNYSGSGGFTNLSKVVDSLGDTPEAQALTKQIAQAFRDQVNKWDGFFDDPNIGYIKGALNAGASPKLAVAVAAQLKADGKTRVADSVLHGVVNVVRDLQTKIKQDVSEYGELTKDLSWLMANSKDKLTPEQMTKAIDAYVAKQGPDWQNKVKEAEDQLMTDVKSLTTDVAALDGAPEDLKQAAPDVFEQLKGVVDDETIQRATEFALSREPSVFEGEEGDKFMATLVEVFHGSKDIMQAATKSYVAGHVFPAVEDLNALHPDTVTRVNKALDDLSRHYLALGLPAKEVNADISKLKELIAVANTTTDIKEGLSSFKETAELKEKLGELKEMTLNAGPMGLTFRVIALAISGKATLNSLHESFDDPTFQGTLSDMANTVGLVNDSIRFANLLKSSGTSADLMHWAVNGGEELFGVLTEFYFLAGAVQDSMQGDTPAVGFDLAGAGGAALATFGEGLGAWTGPVGWAIVTLSIIGVEAARQGHEIRQHTEISDDFLKGAGLDENTAAALSTDGLDDASTLRDQLNLSPKALQDLATRHPEVFSGSAGAVQAVIDAAKASGIQGDDVLPFLDAVEHDNPNYVQVFDANREQGGTAHPLSYASDLFNLVQAMPTAGAFVKAHSPGLVTPDAQAQRAADVAYETSNRSQEAVAGLLATNHNAAYQAEVINLLKQTNNLDTFVQAMGTNDHYNGWPEAARAAIQSAANAGVLTPAQAQNYLAQVG